MSTHQCGHLKLILISKYCNRKRLVEHGRRKWARNREKESCLETFISFDHDSPLVTFSAVGATVAPFSHYLSTVRFSLCHCAGLALSPQNCRQLQTKSRRCRCLGVSHSVSFSRYLKQLHCHRRCCSVALDREVRKMIPVFQRQDSATTTVPTTAKWQKMCYKSIGRYRLLYDNFYSFPLAEETTFRFQSLPPPTLAGQHTFSASQEKGK